MKANISLSLFFVLLASSVCAQSAGESPLQLKGYLETYYVFDFNRPADHTRPDFLYSFNRHNEVNLNFGTLQAHYETERIRGQFSLMVGTYANANLADEPGVLRNIYQANVGVKLAKNQDLWLDAGVFDSHIGFESAIGAVCWNLTRSMMAENSPYFLSGAKVSYTSDNGQWFMAGLLVNGWQRIQRVPGNQTPGFGHQITWTPSERLTLNSSSFIGSDTPDSARQMRYFHNFYTEWQASEQTAFLLGFDVGAEQASPTGGGYNLWLTTVLSVRRTIGERSALATRAEYYHDPQGVIIAADVPGGFRNFGYSCNYDLRITEQVLWRLEARLFQAREPLFVTPEGNSRHNFFMATSLSLAF